jgi:hypothetical protein
VQLARAAACRAFNALEALIHSSNAALTSHVHHELHSALAASVSSKRLKITPVRRERE